jgi:hypothetical protein
LAGPACRAGPWNNADFLNTESRSLPQEGTYPQKRVPTGSTGGASPDYRISPTMVESFFIPPWQRFWTRIFTLAVILGLWITAVVAGCSRDRLATRALHYLSLTVHILIPERKHESRYFDYFD